MTSELPGAVDFHCHWVPEALADALRSRGEAPRIAPRDGGGEEFFAFREALSFGSAHVDPAERLAFMDEVGVATQVLSLPGLFGVDSLPVAEAAPLTRLFNQELAGLVESHPDRFAALAALPIDDIETSIADLRECVGTKGFVGAILPADGFLDRKTAEPFEPLLEAADALGAHLFIHPGPVPGHRYDGGEAPAPPKDNANLRHIVLDVQARLSQVVMTCAMTDLLDAWPNLTVQVANLGGTIPFVVERLDHVHARRSFPGELPSKRVKRVHVDCATFSADGIALAARVFGVDRLLFGSDHPIFDTKSVIDGIAGSDLNAADQSAVMAGNGRAVLERNRGAGR